MKKGFTLTELLAVIAIISVLALVTVPIAISYTEHAKYEAFESGAKSVFDAAKIYITAYEENGDLPIGGIKVEELKKELKNFNYISGSIYRNSEGSIYIENISDGTYCATGTKSDLKIVKGACDNLDSTPPSLKLATNNITSSSITIVATAVDNQSGVLGYSYSIDGINYTEISQESIYEIKNLSANQAMNIYVRAYNNKYDATMSESNPNYEEMIKSTVVEKNIKVTTLEIEKPIFKISSPENTQATVKILDIIYPKNINNYKYTYNIDDNEEIEVTGESTRLTIDKNCVVTAKIYYSGKLITNKIIISSIDNEGPKATVRYNTNWELLKKVIIDVLEEKDELADRPYSFDGGHTWQKENYKIYVQNETLKNKLMVRDKRGNITNKFTINGSGPETDEIIFDFVDKIAPSCEIDATGTQKNDEWFITNVNLKIINLKDYAKYCVDGLNCKNKEPGSGVKSSSLDISSIKTDSIKIVTGTVVDNLGNKGTCIKEIKVDKTNPTISYNVAEGIYNTEKKVTITGSDKYIKNMIVNIYKDGKLVVNKTLTNVSNDKITYSYTIGDGKWVIYAKVFDMSGKSQSKSPTNKDGWYYQSYTIDTKKPTCSLKVTSGTKSGDWYTTNVKIAFNKTDGTGTNIKTSNLSQTQVTSDGTTKIVGTVTDEANNINTCSIVINKDSVQPSMNNSGITITYKPAQNSDKIENYFNIKTGPSNIKSISCKAQLDFYVTKCDSSGCKYELATKTVTTLGDLYNINPAGVNVICKVTTNSNKEVSGNIVFKSGYTAVWSNCAYTEQEGYSCQTNCHSGHCGPCSGGCSYEDGWKESHNAWCSDCCCSTGTCYKPVCRGGYTCPNGGTLNGTMCYY